MTSSSCRVLRGSQRDSSHVTSSASSPFARPCFDISFLSAVRDAGINRDIGRFVQQHALASEANVRQILTRARTRLRDARPRFTASRHESEEIVRRFRHACVTGSVEELMAVLHADATFVSDGGGKAAAATRPLLGADRIAKFVLGYASKLHWSESDF